MAVKFNRLIRGVKAQVAPQVVFPDDYAPRTYYPLKQKWYEQFKIPTEEQRQEALDKLLASWSTPEQREYNATHDICPKCKGRGYPWGAPEVGCRTCGGTGGVPLGEGIKKRNTNRLYEQEKNYGR